MKASWINLRALAILGVVIIHTFTADISQGNQYMDMFVNQLVRFAVPVFYISSGFGLTVTGKNKLNLKEYYSERLKKMLPIMLVSSTLFYLFLCLTEPSATFSIKELIVVLFTGKGYYHLYFLYVLFFYYLIYPLMVRLSSSICGVAICLGITILFQLVPLWSQLPLLSLFSDPMVWLVYFSFGIYYARRRNIVDSLWKYWPIWLILGSVCLFITAFLLNDSTTMRPAVIVYSFGVLSFAMMKLTHENKVLTFLDKHSLLIYILHPAVLWGVTQVLTSQLSSRNFVDSLILFAMTLFGTLIFVVFFIYVGKLFSKDKKSRIVG